MDQRAKCKNETIQIIEKNGWNILYPSEAKSETNKRKQ